MQLHLKSKQVAWCGVIMAIAVILQICAGVIETSSFFLLALASFLAGCVERKFAKIMKDDIMSVSEREQTKFVHRERRMSVMIAANHDK